jgi:hypothetical protein
LEGSRLQPGDHDLAQIPRRDLHGSYLVVEEKIDGANAGISFGAGGELRLQSRGHYLVGGYRERHFALLKTWAARHRDSLWRILGDRYVMFGEWVYAKHTIFYDQLPHYFLEFDLFDTREGFYLDTQERHRRLAGGPVHSVPVLWRGAGQSMPKPTELVRASLYKTALWRENLHAIAEAEGLDVEKVVAETDAASEAEGLYLKVEAEGRVSGRLKWIRHSFLTTVLGSGSHWLDRPIVPNQLHPEVDLYA